MHARKKGAIFALETAFVGSISIYSRLITAASTVHAGSDIGVHEDGQVRLQISAEDAMQFQDRDTAQPASAALVGLAGISKAVAQHDISGCKGRQNDFLNMLSTRCKHQRQFSF